MYNLDLDDLDYKEGNLIENNYNFIKQSKKKENIKELSKVRDESININLSSLYLPNSFLIKMKNMSSKQLFQLLIYFIFTWYIIYKFNFSLRLFLSLFLSVFIYFFIIQNKFMKNFEKSDTINKTIEKLNLFDYKYINIDVDIANCYYNLLFLQKINLTSFNESLNNMNNFLEIYYKIINRNYSVSSNVLNINEIIYQEIENAILFRKKALNILLSTVCSVPQYIGIKNNKYKFLPLENKINFYTNRLDYFSNKKLMDMIETNNKQWSNINNINYNSKFIYVNQPAPNPLLEKSYSPSFNLY